jgi:23S rRNA pseudouridine1911/1915/1917 synthase
MPRVTTVPSGQSPRRLDIFVSAQNAHVSRTLAQRWIEAGVITVNGRLAKPSQRVRPGDVIESDMPRRTPPPVEPEAIPLEVLHEDSEVVIVNKPPGLVMHPAPGHWTGTLLNALVHHVQDAERARPGLVHRLDKGTSGILVIAKTEAALRDLARQFHAHAVHREYLALVAGTVKRGGVIELGLGRDTRDRRRVSARTTRPRRAVTEFRVVERLGRAATVLEVRPRTGRMHQIRAHLASIGHAILGDPTYGAPPDPELGRPMLHAAVLGFIHPGTGRYVEFHAPLPSDMARAVARRRVGASGVMA